MTPEQGWAQMKPILDKEMPVASQSRRFLMFWWAAAAIFTSSVIASFALIQYPGDSSIPAVSDAREINQIPQQHPGDAAEHNCMVGSADKLSSPDILSSNSISDVPSTNINSNKKEIHNAGKSPIDDVLINNHFISEITSVEDQMTPIVELQKANPVLSPAANFGEQLITERVESNEIAAISETRINHTVTPMIDYLDAGELETQSLAVGTVHPGKSSKFKRANNLLTPHLTVGVMKEFQSGLGAHGGAGLDINVSPRLSLTADLGYSVHKPDAALFGGTASELSYDESYGVLKNDLASEGIGNYLPVEVVNNASAQLIGKFVQTVSQWQVSAGVKYDLSRRFFVQAGATYGFGTTARTPIVSNDIDNIPTTGNSYRVDNTFDTHDVLKNTTTVTAGIGYKISPNTEVYAQWSHGLNSYLEGNNETNVYDPTGEFDSESQGNNQIRGIDFGLRHSL